MQESFINDENRPMEIASAVCERSFGTGGFSTERCFKRPLDHALFRLVSLCHLDVGFATKQSLLSTVDIADVLLTASDEDESDITLDDKRSSPNQFNLCAIAAENVCVRAFGERPTGIRGLMYATCYRSIMGSDQALTAVRTYIGQLDDHGLFDFLELGDMFSE